MDNAEAVCVPVLLAERKQKENCLAVVYTDIVLTG
jgi:hypothetical protein